MFNEQERREELNNLLGYEPPSKIDTIISQEKTMLEQAKKEAREEFAEKLKELTFVDDYACNVTYERDIDKLLKEYEEEL